jgi:hypothetical protein
LRSAGVAELTEDLALQVELEDAPDIPDDDSLMRGRR